MVMSLVKIGIFLESGEVQINDHALHMESDLIGYKQIGCQYIYLQLHIHVTNQLFLHGASSHDCLYFVCHHTFFHTKNMHMASPLYVFFCV